MSGISSNLLSKLMGLFGKGVGVALLLFITIFQNNQHQNILIFFTFYIVSFTSVIIKILSLTLEMSQM
jgi:hypothetical protein